MFATITRTLVTTPRPPQDGDLRTMFKNGMDSILVYWSRTEGSFSAAKDDAERFAPARVGVKPIGTEMRRNGRWFIVGKGEDCPCF